MSQRQFFSRILFASILFSSITPLFGMEEVPPKDKEEINEGVPFNLKNDNNAYRSDAHAMQEQDFIPQQSLRSKKGKKKKCPFGILNEGYNKRLFEESSSNAPEKIHKIIDTLSDPTENTEEVRCVVLHGLTGSGKTTLAKAIISVGLKNNYFFVQSTSLLDYYQHKTCKNIHKLFKKFIKLKPMPGLILDEVNILGEKHLQEQSDGSEIAHALWSNIDTFIKEGGFIIATANNLKKMPHPLQRRFVGTIVEIPYKSLSFKHLEFAIGNHPKYSLAEECKDPAYLEVIAQQTQMLSTAEINRMVGLAVIEARQNSKQKIATDDTDKTIKVTRHNLDLACQDILYQREHFCDFSEQILAEERRHRETLTQNRELSDRSHNLSVEQHAASHAQNANHHAQSHAQSVASHAQNAAHHAATQAANELHFVQGIRAHAHMSMNNIGGSGGIGGAGINGSASIGNIGRKDYVYAYTFNAQQLAINAELNQESDRRVTTLGGEIRQAAPIIAATVARTVAGQTTAAAISAPVPTTTKLGILAAAAIGL